MVDGHDETIVPRNVHFGISRSAKRFWLDDDAFKTYTINGMSLFLPEGERFFIKSLKHYAAEVALHDPALAAAIGDFSVQEAYHTREHEDYNRSLQAMGYDVEAAERRVAAALDGVKRPLTRLAVTCAFEHMTTTFSKIILRNPSLLDGATAPYRRLWTWHALEEVEHKAVAIDVFKLATRGLPRWKRYVLRTAVMHVSLFAFFTIYFRIVASFRRSDGGTAGLAFWLRFLWVIFIAPGILGRSVGPILAYYLPGFDPGTKDDRTLVMRWRSWLDTALAAGA